MEQHFPFTDIEKRFVLIEILKKSNVPLEKIVAFIRENNVQPDWEHVFLPQGRDLSECKQAFIELLRNGQSSQLHTHQLPPSFPHPPAIFHGTSSTSSKRQSMGMPPGPETKKRKSGTETPTLARDLLPKPMHPGSNSPSMTTMSSSPAPTSQKKRGRPSKADQERKQREAMERGEIITPGPMLPSAGLQGQEDIRPHPSPVSILPAPRPLPTGVTLGHILSPQMAMEHGPSPTMGSEATVRKRKPKPPPKPKAQKPGEGQFLINPPAGQPAQEEATFTPVSTDAPQAGPIAALPGAGIPSASIASTITPDPARTEQPQPDDNRL